MKLRLNSWRPNQCSSTRQTILWVGCAIGLLAGCSKHAAESPTAAAPAPVDTNASQSMPESQPVAAATAPSPTMAATNSAPDLRPLNQALLTWILQNRRHPASFEDFAATAGIEIPPPPPGKKYIIDRRGLISLADR